MLNFDRRGILALSAILPFLRIDGAFGEEAASAAAWDLTEIYPHWAAWDAARKDVLAALPRLAAYKGTLGTSAATMAKALIDISDESKAATRVYVYASLSGDADVRVAQNQERLGQAGASADPGLTFAFALRFAERHQA